MKKLLFIILTLFSLYTSAQVVPKVIKVQGIGGNNNPDSLKDHDGSEYLLQTVADAAYKPISYVPAWSDITGKPTLFSGDYNDLANKPTIPDVTGKMNYTDSAAMLSPYLRKIDTTGKWISTAVANATFATITSLDLKADDNNVVHLTGDETINGNKTISDGTSSVTIAPTNLIINNPSVGINTLSGSGMIVNRTAAYFGNSLPGQQFIIRSDNFMLRDQDNVTTNFQINSGHVFNYLPVYFKAAANSIGDFVTRDSSTGLINVRTAPQALSDMGGLSTTTAASTYATITALNLKANDNAVAHNTGDETWSGNKTFTSSITVNDGLGSGNFNGAGFSFNRANAYYTNVGGNIRMQSKGLLLYDETNTIQIAQFSNIGSYIFTPLRSVNSTYLYNLSNANTGQVLTVDTSTHLVSFNTKNTAFNKNFGTTTGTVMDGKQAMDSIAALRSNVDSKLPATYKQSVVAIKPLHWNIITPDSATLNLNVDTTSALSDNSDTTVASTKAVRTYVATKADKANPVFTGTAKINSDTLATKADVRASAGGGGSFPDLSGRNYASDSLAVTVGGLGLYDLYRNGSDVKIVSKLPDLTANQFKWTIDNSADNAAYAFIVYSSDFNMNVVVDWGDGTTSNFNGAKTYTPSHSYTTTGTYAIKVFVDDLTKVNQVYLNSNNRSVVGSKFINFDGLTNLKTLSLINLDMASADTISYPASLTSLDLYDNNNTGFVTPENLTVLSNLDIGGNFINTSNLSSTLVLPSSLTVLSGEFIGGWGVSNLNAMLVYLDGLTFTNPVDFDFAGNGAPTGTGATAKTSLISKGNTVETD